MEFRIFESLQCILICIWIDEGDGGRVGMILSETPQTFSCVFSRQSRHIEMFILLKIKANFSYIPISPPDPIERENYLVLSRGWAHLQGAPTRMGFDIMIACSASCAFITQGFAYITSRSDENILTWTWMKTRCLLTRLFHPIAYTATICQIDRNVIVTLKCEIKARMLYLPLRVYVTIFLIIQMHILIYLHNLIAYLVWQD